MTALPESHKVVRLHAPFDIRVESVPIPKIEHPDDAIVKVKFAGLCGSDLHAYRGHESVDTTFTTGHEFVGEVVALGSSFTPNSDSFRPALYATLQVGNKVVSPFTSSCGECHFCRVGFSSRCAHQLLFGTPVLPGAQAQYVRVPKAGGTLYKVPPDSFASEDTKEQWADLSDSSLLLLADILPTGCYAAIQVIQHPKLLPMIMTRPFPASSFLVSSRSRKNEEVQSTVTDDTWPPLSKEDQAVVVAAVGLGPVGVCAVIGLLDNLAANNTPFKFVAIDPNETRRIKMKAVYAAIDDEDKGEGIGTFEVASIEDGKKLVDEWTGGIGCNAVMEVVGNNSALTLAYDLIRPFGVIVSVGVHQQPQVPFTGRQLYNKNVSLEFGRCPVRAMFPVALELLLRRQDVFGGIGEESSLVDKIVGIDNAPNSFDDFDKGRCGKVIFDPWK